MDWIVQFVWLIGVNRTNFARQTQESNSSCSVSAFQL